MNTINMQDLTAVLGEVGKFQGYKIMVKHEKSKTWYSHSIVGTMEIAGNYGGTALITTVDSYDNKNADIFKTWFLDEFKGDFNAEGEVFHYSGYSLKLVNVAEQEEKERQAAAAKEAEKVAAAEKVAELERVKAELAAVQAQLAQAAKAASPAKAKRQTAKKA